MFQLNIISESKIILVTDDRWVAGILGANICRNSLIDWAPWAISLNELPCGGLKIKSLLIIHFLQATRINPCRTTLYYLKCEYARMVVDSVFNVCMDALMVSRQELMMPCKSELILKWRSWLIRMAGAGEKKCSDEKSLTFRFSFQIVPYRFPIDSNLI